MADFQVTPPAPIAAGDIDRFSQPIDSTAPGQLDPTPLPGETGPLEALGAAYGTGANLAGIVVRSQLDALTMRGMEPVTGFDPFDRSKYDLSAYGEYASRFVDASSPAQADFIKSRIDGEREAADTLSRAGPVTAGAANIIAGLGPEMLLNPGGGIVRQALGQAAVMAGRSTILQGTLGKADALATTLEDAASAAGLGAAFGALHQLGEWVATKPAPAVTAVGQYFKDTDRAIADSSGAEAMAAAGAERNMAESTVGAQQTPGASIWGPDDGKLASAFGTEKIGTTAFMRAANSAVDTVRDLAFGLADGGLFQQGNFRNLASEQAVEARIGANWNGKLYDLLHGTMGDYLEHRGATPSDSPLTDMAILKAKDLVNGGPTSGFLSFKEFKQGITDALENGDRHYVPQVEQAAGRYRALADDLKAQGIDARIWSQGADRELADVTAERARTQDPVKGAVLDSRIAELKDLVDRMETIGPNPAGSDTWFKRLWLHGEVRARRGELEGRIDQHIAANPVLRAQGWTGKQAVDAILERKPFRQAVDDPVPTKSSMRERGLGWIPSTLVSDFLERDSEVLMRKYHREMAVDIELSKRFGSWDMKDVIDEAKTNGATDANIEDVRTLRDFLRSTAGFEDPDSLLTHGAHLAKMYANVVNLGGSTLTALMDTARPIMTEGISRVFESGLKPFLAGGGRAAMKIAGRDAIDAGVGGEMLLWLRTHGQAGTGPLLSSDSKFMQGAEKAHSLYFMANLIAPWTEMMKSWTTMIVSGRIRDAARTLAEGGALDAGDQLRLRRAGLDDAMLRRIHDQFETHGIDTAGSRAANLGAWTDKTARDSFAAAIHSDVNRTIVTPGIADKATWMEKGIKRANGDTLLPASVAGVLSQYYAFAIASTQKMMVSGLQQRDMAFLSGTLATVALAHIVNKIRDNLNAGPDGKHNSRTGKDQIVEAIDRSGTLGYFGNINNAIERLSGETVGIRPATGISTRPRFGARQLSGLGPTGGTLANLSTIVHGVATNHWTARQANAARKILPLQNIFYADQLFDGVEGGMRGFAAPDKTLY
jgi:hypothetical protein